jgi:hypothetical protein
VNEVDEIARIGRSVEVCGDGRAGQDGYPHTGKRRAQNVPHRERYRPP